MVIAPDYKMLLFSWSIPVVCQYTCMLAYVKSFLRSCKPLPGRHVTFNCQMMLKMPIWYETQLHV